MMRKFFEDYFLQILTLMIVVSFCFLLIYGSMSTWNESEIVIEKVDDFIKADSTAWIPASVDTIWDDYPAHRWRNSIPITQEEYDRHARLSDFPEYKKLSDRLEITFDQKEFLKIVRDRKYGYEYLIVYSQHGVAITKM